ncbi:MAG: response regulator [SAR324 cluster bacterium]|nr:response regulator [SAR324 cluster bacterium]
MFLNHTLTLNRMEEKSKILIVDDEPDNLFIVGRTLGKLEVDVVKANSGYKAMEALSHHQVALVILDVRMPGMNGYEVAEWIRGQENTKHVPIIFLSAAYTDQHVFKGYESGAVDFLIKPADSRILLNKVRVFVALDQQMLVIQQQSAKLQQSLAVQREISDNLLYTTAKLKTAQKDAERINIQLEKEIAEHKKTEEILKESEEKYRLIAETANDAILTISSDSIILFANHAAETIFGYSSEEILGQNLTIIMPQHLQNAHLNALEKYISTNEKHTSWKRVAVPGVHKNGREIPLEVSFGEIIKEGDRVFIGIIRDITEREQMEKELRLARDLAEQSSQAKSQFLANMSHEIRTPLNAIVGFSQILSRRAESLTIPHDFAQYLKTIQNSGENLSELINNILDLSKIEAGKLSLAKEVLNLNLLVQGIYHINKAAASKKKLVFTYELTPELPELVISDRNKLNQILMNLTSNAIKFTPEKKQVWLRTKREKDFMILEVEDRGIGIPADRREAIFEAFEQGSNKVVLHFGGTGLGLAVTQKMTELLEGSVRVESTEGKGSLFSVKIPLVEATGEVTYQTELNWEDYHFSKNNRILVVEDNPTNQEMMKIIFQDLGLRINLADSGAKGIEKTLKMQGSGTPPDLILMDIHMPGMTGLEATTQIRSVTECKDIPIVALSADAFYEQQQEAFRVGINDYLTKPLQVNKLLQVLGKYLRQEKEKIKKTSQKKRSLPTQNKKQLMMDFEKLQKIPFYMTGNIHTQLQKMQRLCEKYDSPYPEILDQIQSAIFSKQVKKANSLIKKALHG